MRIMATAAIVSMVCGLAGAAKAQQKAISPADIVRNPGAYVNKPVVWQNGYCFRDDKGFVCIGENMPFEVIADSISAGPVRSAIEENCGGLDGIERNPSNDCRYAFSFQASGFSAVTGDYVLNGRVQSGKRIVRFRAQMLTPLR